MKTTYIPVMLFAVFHFTSLRAEEIRYADVTYLDEWKQPPLHLKVLRRAPLLFSPDSRGVIGFLAPGQSVEVIGLGENQHYVAARVATGPAKGWVDADALEKPSPEFLAKLSERRQKGEAHRELIERHEVVVGMTRVEVRASLGQPDRTARRRTKLGDEEQWFYIAYKYRPHYARQEGESGKWRPLVSYRRTPAGHKVITFSGDEVVEVADDQPRELQAPPVKAAPSAPVVTE